MPKKRPLDDQEKEIKRKKLLSEVAKGKLPFLKPGQGNFDSLMREKYFNFVLRPSSCVPQVLQEELARALRILDEHGYFYRDWVKVKGQTVPTPVSRTLVGEPGTTYKYLGLRLFTVPWSFGKRQPESEVEIACESIAQLNAHYKSVARHLLRDKHKDKPGGLRETTPDLSVDEGTNFNVALINYMDPSDPHLRLKPEPYYGMGPLAVSWHKDDNLVQGSTVAVYSHICSEGEQADSAIDWMVGLKVAWDIETPGVAVPLRRGESYFMLDSLNDTHQHCVVAGSQARFSSTHRVANSCRGTLVYIQQQCKKALSNLTDQSSEDYHLNSLDTECLELSETVHNELEFEWLRQFWMQGAQHARERGSWVPAMEALETEWKKMEHMTKLALDEASQRGSEEGGNSIAIILLPHLQHRQQMRQECLHKFSPTILDTMHLDHRPIHRPMWEVDDTARPLPFDLEDPIAKLRLLCKQAGLGD